MFNLFKKDELDPFSGFNDLAQMQSIQQAIKMILQGDRIAGIERLLYCIDRQINCDSFPIGNNLYKIVDSKLIKIN